MAALLAQNIVEPVKAVSLIGSLSRRAGGLFESVRRLHQQLIANPSSSQSKRRQVCDRSIDVRVLGLVDEFTHEDLSAWSPVPVVPFKVFGPRSFGYAPGVVDAMTIQCPDVVHVHGLWQYASVATRLWHRTSQRPYIVSPHGMLDQWAIQNSAWKKKIAWSLYEKWHLRGAACIRALCSAELDAIRTLGLQNPVCVIPNGIDLPELHDPVRPEAKPPAYQRQPQKILLYLGRLHPKKGLENLLRAWAATWKRNGWVLAIAGWDDGGHESELKQLGQRLGISSTNDAEGQDGSSLHFLGPKFGRDKESWLRNCDAAVLPSLSEGLPMAVLEAWAHAKPVLLTAKCNLPEGPRAGAAFEMGPGVDGARAGLRTLFDTNDDELQSMGQRGRQLVADKFAWPQIAADLRAVYQWAVLGGGKPDCIRLHE